MTTIKPARGVTIPTKAKVPDSKFLVGKYFRHEDNLRIYKVLEVGPMGATLDEVEGMDLPSLRVEPCLVTWPALQRFYRLLVQASEIDNLH